MEKTAPGWLENPLLEGRGGAIIGSRKFAKETPWLGPKEVGKIREGTLRDAIVGTQRWPIILPSLRQSNKFHVNGILFGSHSSIPPDQSFRSFSLFLSLSLSLHLRIFSLASLLCFVSIWDLEESRVNSKILGSFVVADRKKGSVFSTLFISS